MTPPTERISVVGVPRGGTSAVVGLLRILGYRLPDLLYAPSCFQGEAAVLRWADNALSWQPGRFAPLVSELPAGTVWKDPAVAVYAEQVDWTAFTVVRVRRDAAEVRDSERRWLPTGEDHEARAREWNARLNAHIPPGQVVADLRFETVRADPVQTTLELAARLGLAPPNPDQLALAGSFISYTSAYRCPLPGRCETGPSGHRGAPIYG